MTVFYIKIIHLVKNRLNSKTEYQYPSNWFSTVTSLIWSSQNWNWMQPLGASNPIFSTSSFYHNVTQIKHALCVFHVTLLCSCLVHQTFSYRGYIPLVVLLLQQLVPSAEWAERGWTRERYLISTRYELAGNYHIAQTRASWNPDLCRLYSYYLLY